MKNENRFLRRAKTAWDRLLHEEEEPWDSPVVLPEKPPSLTETLANSTSSTVHLTGMPRNWAVLGDYHYSMGAAVPSVTLTGFTQFSGDWIVVTGTNYYDTLGARHPDHKGQYCPMCRRLTPSRHTPPWPRNRQEQRAIDAASRSGALDALLRKVFEKHGSPDQSDNLDVWNVEFWKMFEQMNKGRRGSSTPHGPQVLSPNVRRSGVKKS